MNIYTNTVVDYLLKGGAQRQEALKDLIDRGIVTGDNPWPEQTKVSVNKYLEENPRGFCDEGIKRFRKATSTPEPEKKPHKVTFTIEAEIGPNWPDNGRGGFAGDSMVGANIAKNIIGKELGIGVGHADGKWTFTKAKIVEGWVDIHE